MAASIVAATIAAFVAILAIATPSSAAGNDAGDIFSGLNSARASAGMPALVHNDALDAVALAWANQMAVNGAMTHNPNTGSQIPAGWSGWGENVAYGFVTGAATTVGWTDSPSHYENMVGSFSDVGIAFVAAGGTTWAVEVFAEYPATAAVAAAADTATGGTSAPVSSAPVSSAPVSSAPASTVATSAQPIGYVGLVAVPAALTLIVFILLRERRRRVVAREAAR